MSHINMDGINKAFEIASAVMQGQTELLCPNCDTKLEVNPENPLSGVHCKACGKRFPWQHWVDYQKGWIWDDDHTGLRSVGGDESDEIELPRHCQKIYSYAFSKSKISRIRIGSHVTVIEPYAFADAHDLRHVELPEGLQRIEDGAFQQCSNLQSVTIPDTVTYIGKRAFSGCIKLKKVQLPDSLRIIDKYAFAGSGLEEIRLPNVVLVGKSAFQSCMDLCSATLQVTHIEDSCFDGCINLQTLQLGNNLLTIGEKAFLFCMALQDLYIPASTYEIGNRAFAFIDHLTVRLPNTLKEYVTNYRIHKPDWSCKNYIFNDNANLQYYEGSV